MTCGICGMPTQRIYAGYSLCWTHHEELFGYLKRGEGTPEMWWVGYWS